MPMRSKLMVANWKMHGSLSANASLVETILAGMTDVHCRAALCVPSVFLAQLQVLLAASPVDLGAQDVSAHPQGAFTGEVSADMLKEFSVRCMF